MLRSENDPFLYLFADEDDIYFSKHLLKEDIYKKIYYKAKEKQYELVLYFFRLNNNETEIICGTLAEAQQYAAFTKLVDTSLFSFFNTETNYEKNKEGHYSFKQKNSTIQRVIDGLVNRDKDRFIFVFPIDTFVEIYCNDESRKSFSRLIEDKRHDKGSQFIFLESDINRNTLPILPIKQDNKQIVWKSLEEEMKTIWEPFERRQLKRMMERISLMYPEEYLCALKDHPNRTNFIEKQLSSIERNRRFNNKKDLYEYYSKKENYCDLIGRL